MRFPKVSFLIALMVPTIGIVSANKFEFKKEACPKNTAENDLIENAVIKTNGERNKDSYTIVFRPSQSSQSLEDMAINALAKTGGSIRERGLLPLINGVLVTMTELQAEAMAKHPEVKYVQENSIKRGVAANANKLWNLDRIDQKTLPLNGFYDRNRAPKQGEGTVVYVVDSGILANHVEFEGRVFTNASYDFVEDGYDGIDCHGHGTMVAGIVGGKSVGVANKTKLVAVRSLDCYNDDKDDWITRGIQKVAADCPNGISAAGTPFPNHTCIVNLSLGYNYTRVWNEAVKYLSDMGIVVSVAASNGGGDSCGYDSDYYSDGISPACAKGAFTVGATQRPRNDGRNDTIRNDTIWYNSCHGPALDIWAPGANVYGADYNDRTSSVGRYDSGTSFAAPAVAGVAALVHAEFDDYSSEDVKNFIRKSAIDGYLTNDNMSYPKYAYRIENSTNRQLYIPDLTVRPTPPPTVRPEPTPPPTRPTPEPPTPPTPPTPEPPKCYNPIPVCSDSSDDEDSSDD